MLRGLASSDDALRAPRYTGTRYMAVQLHVRTYSREVVTHSHGHHQLVLPLRGALVLSVRGRALRAEPGAGSFVAAGEAHAFAAAGDDRFLVADLPPAVPVEHGLEAWVERAARDLIVPVDPATGDLARVVARQLALRPVLARSETLAAALLATLAAPLDPPRTASPRLERALAFIEARGGAGLDVAAVAAEVDLGPSQLHALFRRELRATPAAIIAEAQLRSAERLLLDTAQPIAEIALACGYADQSSLTRSMRRRRGVTPAALRRSNRP